jgi:hypothetical protein
MAKDSNISQTGGGTRISGGISGKGGVNVNPKYKEVGPSVKVITPGTKPVTKPNVPYHIGALRSPAELKRMGL